VIGEGWSLVGAALAGIFIVSVALSAGFLPAVAVAAEAGAIAIAAGFCGRVW